MAELIIAEKSDLVNVANSIRRLNGTSVGMNVIEMGANVDDVCNGLDSAIGEQDWFD